jgi:hypothetical protein
VALAHYAVVTSNLKEETWRHLAQTRYLVEDTRREVREAAEHIAESIRIMDESQKHLKRPRDPAQEGRR